MAAASSTGRFIRERGRKDFTQIIVSGLLYRKKEQKKPPGKRR